MCRKTTKPATTGPCDPKAFRFSTGFMQTCHCLLQRGPSLGTPLPPRKRAILCSQQAPLAAHVRLLLECKAEEEEKNIRVPVEETQIKETRAPVTSSRSKKRKKYRKASRHHVAIMRMCNFVSVPRHELLNGPHRAACAQLTRRNNIKTFFLYHVLWEWRLDNAAQMQSCQQGQ